MASSLRQTSNVVHVPDNCVANLMYYLNCVLDLIDYNDNNLYKFCDYENYDDLSAQELRVLWVLCLTLSPDELIDKCMFQSNVLCGTSTNRFYELSQTQQLRLMVSSTIFIGGQARRVKKFMAYRQVWMVNNYIQPMLQLPGAIQRQIQFEQVAENISQACIIS
ncbi:unnamed protein product [Didymodactylos carnosus]|uniref:Uncharacterized protein n=1 Tax=Didymodactylos carnosus TaxID=1234261 RepID=A0A815MC72_9BILA|nr:unnamed protein product [Didymodactylos carnosus]CAF1511219.1 unnamed protein product [Didymodactylos carnosus]CAF4299031.1 unnamed protein product [Didymodactylos carnosus]CAF4304950.1 unnamed protein product [Didymodactylos carnosus]